MNPWILSIQIGCEVMFFPSAYSVGSAGNWDLVFRSRAKDNQLYTVAISPARDLTADYVCWGHSFVADPTGKIVAQAGISEEILLVDMGKFVVSDPLLKLASVLLILTYLFIY